MTMEGLMVLQGTASGEAMVASTLVIGKEVASAVEHCCAIVGFAADQ